MRGALAHDGQLSVHRDALIFEPTGDLDRQLGARTVTLPLDTITGVSLSPDGAFLSVRLAGQRYRFAGRDLGRVAGLLAPETAEAPPALPAGEPLVEGIVDIRQSGAPWQTARLRLTPTALEVTALERVRGGRGPAPLVLRTWEVPDADLDPVRGRLHLHGPGLRVTLRGAPAPAVADRLAQLAAGVSVEPLPDPILRTVRAGLRRGPVAHWGSLRLSASGLRFQPTGLIDTLVGVRPFSHAWAEIRRLAPVPDEDRQVELVTASGRTRLELADADLPDMLRLMHHAQVAAALAPEAANTACRAVLQSWAGRAEGADAPPVLASPALRLSADGGARAGALVLTEGVAAFLPEDPGDLDGLGAWPIGSMSRVHAIDLSFPSTIRFDADGEDVRLVPALGAGLRRAFWARCRAPSRVVPWEDLRPRSRSRVTGEATFARVQVDDRTLEARPGRALEHPRGWGVVLDGGPADAPPAGARITVEIGQPEGVYQFDAQVEAALPVPAHLRAPGGPPRCVLVVRDRSAIRVFNQREGIRVAAVLTVSVQRRADRPAPIQPVGPSPAITVDLSIGGCQLLTHLDLMVGDRVRATLELPGKEVQAQAEVVRAQPADPDSGWATVAALRFLRVAQVDEDRIHRFVLDAQRATLRGDPGAVTPSGVPADIAP